MVCFLPHRDPMNKFSGEKIALFGCFTTAQYASHDHLCLMMTDGVFFQVVHTIEAAFPTCAAFADQDTLVTGSDDSLVRIWRLSHASPSASPFIGSTKGQEPSLSLVHLLRKHSAPISCLRVCRVWSVVISGSLDGSSILWDLNRGLYVRSIWHAGGDNSIQDAAVHLVAINESTVRLDFIMPSHHDQSRLGLHCDVFYTRLMVAYYQCTADCEIRSHLEHASHTTTLCDVHCISRTGLLSPGHPRNGTRRWFGCVVYLECGRYSQGSSGPMGFLEGS